jgi:hypothetical protein
LAQWIPTLLIEGGKETRDQLRVDQLEVKVVIVGNVAELTKGNKFRTRVYPIPTRGTKRVDVTFREVLPLHGDSLSYRLPLDFKKPLSRFAISIAAPYAVGDLEVLEDSSSGLIFTQTAKRGRRLGSIRTNYVAQGPLEVSIPIKPWQGFTLSCRGHRSPHLAATRGGRSREFQRYRFPRSRIGASQLRWWH